MHLKHICFILLYLKICDAKSSLIFVVDTTNSMYYGINEIISASKKILETVVKSKSSMVEKYVLITFKDPEVYVSKYTKDPVVFNSVLTHLSKEVIGGDDCPEYSMRALENALQNSEPKSFIYVFTDASAKDYERVNRVKQLVQKLQSRVIFVLTGTCSSKDDDDYQVYQEIATISSGLVFHCKKNEIGKVLETVPIFLNGESSVLTSKFLIKGNRVPFTFNVDDRTDDVTVSISGEDVKIFRVTDPDRKPFNSYTKIVYLKDIKIIKLTSPTPGTYTVFIQSDIRATVVVNGKTLIDFQQGFSGFEPKSINDTSRQPIKGQKTRLSVNIQDPNKNFELQEVQILTVHETVLERVPVKNIDNNFFVSEPFMPPNDLFKICILGKDKVTGRQIRRLGKTFIEPQKPELVPPNNKKPIVKIPEGTTINVEYGSDVKISCQISAYPHPAVTWEDQTGKIVTSTATAVELPYDYVSYLEVDKMMKPDKYTCKANNKEGSNFDIVHVNIKPILKFVEKPKDQSIALKEDGMLLCKVTTYPPATIKWYFNNKEISTNDKFSISPDKSQLKLKNVDDNNIGTYKCEVDNGVEKKVLEAKVNVTGMVPPKLNKSVSQIHSNLQKEIILRCQVLQGNPEPKFSWYYKTRDSTKQIDLPDVDKEIKVAAVVGNNRARYTCTVKNYVGQDSVDFEIILDQSPEFSAGTLKLFKPKVDEEVTLPCSVDGEPKPNIKWSRNGIQLQNGNKYTIGPDNSLKFLADKGDSSQYECTASNKFGTVNYRAEVSVLTPPEISKETKTTKITINNNLKLQCKVKSGNPKPVITWFKKGVTKNLPSVGEYLDLPITDINQAGIYYCEAKNSMGMDSHSINVVVEYPPRSTKKESFVEVKQGAEAKLECEVYGVPKPKVQWIRNDNTITDRKYRLEDNILRFPATFHDNGAYYCVSSNDYGQLKYKVNLNVLAPPEISKETKTTTISINNNLTLQCKVKSGNPKPVITWYKKGVTNKFISVGEYLILPITDINQAGIYYCEAKNSIAMDSHSINVVVESPPEISKETITTKTLINNNLKLQCKVKSGNPKPVITWFKKGVTKNLPSDGEYLNLPITDINQAGIYYCEAKNSMGMDSHSINVVVEYSPRSTKKESFVEVKQGAEAKLECEVYGEPKPKVQWIRNDNTITDRKYRLEDNILRFPATFHDNGAYFCVSSNDYGQLKYKVNLNVLAPPEISKETKTTTIPINNNLTLQCKVKSGNPKPVITWFKKDVTNNLTSVGEYLNMPITDINQAGIYYCEAKNSMGIDSHSINVVVESRPEISKETITTKIPINNNLKLQCKVKSGNPKPVITWFKKGVTNNLLSVGEYLNLPITNINQGGIYYCEAKNSMGIDSHSINVVVEYRPRSYKKESFVEVKQGAEAKLECEVYGVPKPKVQWIRNDNTITDSKYRLEDNILRFPADFHDNGTYYCVSSNDYGLLKYTVNLNVLAPAKIVNNPHDNPYEAIIGDYVLKVPCLVEGNPLPAIVWKRNEKLLVPDNKYALDSNMTITIKNPEENVNFTCFAKNIYGKDNRTFQVIVNEFMNTTEASEHIYLLKGENKHIKCPTKNNNGDERWFKIPLKRDNNMPLLRRRRSPSSTTKMSENGITSFKGEFHIKNASIFDDGYYICRVSNMEGSKSYPVYIDVGWPPKPIYENLGPIEFNGADQRLHCEVDVKPYPIIHWWHNGEILENQNDTLLIDHWGNYNCFVQSVHGNFSRNFEVIAKDCLIKLDPDIRVHDALVKPLMLTLDSIWLDKIINKYNNVPSESMVKLACPDKKKSNYIKQFKKSQIIAQCKGRDQFDINGKLYKFSELKCTKELEPTMKETKETCLDDKSELVKVGFETSFEFVNVYNICIDKEKRVPLYTEMNLTTREYAYETVLNYKWTKDLSANVNYDYIYDCNIQRSKFRNIFKSLTNNCCMIRVQLVDPINLYNSIQLTTFNYLNTVPVWNNCNAKSNWFHLENDIRQQADYLEGLRVWTGVSGVLQMADEFNVSINIYLDDEKTIPVPLYLWKVVSYIELEDIVAIIYVNVPNLKGDAINQYTKCKDISKEIEWTKHITWNKEDQGGYFYYCHLDEFTNAFNISTSIFKDIEE